MESQGYQAHTHTHTHLTVKEGTQLGKNSPLCSLELVAGPGVEVEFSILGPKTETIN